MGDDRLPEGWTQTKIDDWYDWQARESPEHPHAHEWTNDHGTTKCRLCWLTPDETKATQEDTDV